MYNYIIINKAEVKILSNDLNKKIKIAAVVGCTGSGKTALSIELAKRFNGEVISCDSMQIYKGMDVGTAKVTSDEMHGIRHHLIDFLEPSEPYSCADYVRDAEQAINGISGIGKLPIFCGGTGLYLDRLLHGGNDECAVCDEDYRKELFLIAERENGIDTLHDMLMEKDFESASKIHKNNVKRVIRALEIIHATGMKKSESDKKNSEINEKYSSLVLYPYYNDRSILYERIDKRVDMMIKSGLVDETERLYKDGIFEISKTASQAIGYKELLPYIKGRDSLENCIENLKCATRRYAKRQNTWFSGKDYVTKVSMDDECGIKTFEEIVNICEKLFHMSLFCDII